MKSATGGLYVDTLAKLIRPDDATLLEVGCGQGEVLVEARKRGFAVTGIEFSRHAADVANARLGTQAVHVGSIEDVPLSAGQFDAILAADVIEHVRDPKTFLIRARRLLRPGGLVILITPSLDSWTRRFLQNRWLEYKVEHLSYFSTSSIRRLLDSCGFDEVRVSPSRKILTFDYIWRHFERFTVPVVSPLLGLLRRLIPEKLAYRHLRIPASGLIAIGRKQDRSDPHELPGL